MKPELKSKLKLTFLLLITALPVTVATFSFKSALESGSFGGSTNNGNLILPPADITAMDMRDESGDPQFKTFEELIAGIDADEYQTQPWLMVYVTASNCEVNCLERIHYLQQLHTRLGKHRPRVRRYFLHTADQPIEQQNKELFRETYPSMGIAYGDRERITQNLADAGVVLDLDNTSYVFLVDPVGNVMMYYTDQHGHEEIKFDLDRLLKYSALG
jgi:hypothetical protein